MYMSSITYMTNDIMLSVNIFFLLFHKTYCYDEYKPKLKKNQVKFLFFLKLFYFILKYVFKSIKKVIFMLFTFNVYF